MTTRAADGAPHGLTVNSFTSLSLSPPLVLVAIDHGCSILPHFQAHPYFAVNVLRDSQRDISVRFAEWDADRFDGLEWSSGETGVPVLLELLALFECRTVQQMDAGDHTILIGEVVHAEFRDGSPLVFFDSDYRYLDRG